jgi:hypothetical protein
MSDLDPRRLGCMTASMAAVIMGGLNTEGLLKYVQQLAGERLYGDLGEEQHESEWMKRGKRIEAAMLSDYEFNANITLERQPFVPHPTIPYVAATPDGLLRGVRNYEAKNPSWPVWCDSREQWFNGKRGFDCIPARYRWQVRWQSWCCGVTNGVFLCGHPAGGGKFVIVPYEVEQTYFDQMAEG